MLKNRNIAAALFLFAILSIAPAGARPLPSGRQQDTLQTPLKFSVRGLSFSPTQTGTKSDAKIVLLNNVSNQSQNFLVFTFKGTNPADFTQTNTCGSFVPPGTSCVLRIFFTPAKDGDRSATIEVSKQDSVITILTINGNGEPQAAPAEGTTPPGAAKKPPIPVPWPIITNRHG
jgi:hypothetical protein